MIGKLALHQVRLVEPLVRKRLDIDGGKLARHLHVGGLGIASLCNRNAVDRRKRVNVVLRDAQRRQDAHVEQLLAVVEIVGSRAQVIAARLEAREHGGSQDGDHDDGHEPF